MTNSSLPLFVQQMLQPDFYPHPVKESIELIQTHISFILLTGEYAYKLKKNVDLGFLDYSTLEKRREFCFLELSLNQRTAPELYLEVVGIIQKGDRFQLTSPDFEEKTGESSPVEYAVKMRQFPQKNLFTALFEAGKLTEKDLEKTGEIVAKFHLEAPTNDYISKFGEVSQIRQSLNNNYQLTEKYIGGPQTEKQYEETKEYTDLFLNKYREVFDKRINNNWIRECHGDLHLRNMCKWQDKIILFDCIEFKEAFRFVDVMYDVAFTVMDLEAKKRTDLANAFLNTYIEQTGDWEGLQVLPLYLSRQAYVRAKVNSLVLDDSSISEEKKQEATKEAASYYKLAWEYAIPRCGRLILMSGLSGSGKSTNARYLARGLGAIQIRSDAVRKHLAGLSLEAEGGEDLYSSEMTQKTYQRLVELGGILAKIGFTVILDAKFDRLQFRKEAMAIAKENQLPFNILYCDAPRSVLRSRLQQRQGDISDATADLLNSQISEAEPFAEEEKNYLTTIDTTQFLDSQLDSLIANFQS